MHLDNMIRAYTLDNIKALHAALTEYKRLLTLPCEGRYLAALKRAQASYNRGEIIGALLRKQEEHAWTTYRAEYAIEAEPAIAALEHLEALDASIALTRGACRNALRALDGEG